MRLDPILVVTDKQEQHNFIETVVYSSIDKRYQLTGTSFPKTNQPTDMVTVRYIYDIELYNYLTERNKHRPITDRPMPR